MEFSFRHNQAHFLLIFILWFCCAFFVNPIGEFPLNDDWAYAKNVFHLSEHGDLVFDDWPAMTLIVHMLWGAMFTSVFGFSFTVLRISILILGFVGIWGCYLVIMKISRNHILALIGALTLAFNPLYFSLSYTFMTDVSFLALIIWSTYFYLLYIEKPQLKNLIIATFFVILATLTRQLGVWAAISFMISYFFFKMEGRKVAGIALISMIPLVVLAIFPFWLRWVDVIPSHYSSVSDLLNSSTISLALQNFFHRSGVLLFSLGLFLLPVLLLIFLSVWKQMRRSDRFKAAFVSIIALYPLILNLKHVPVGNVFHNFGLGPKVLKDTYWGLNFRPVMSDVMQYFFYGLGLTGSILLIFVCYVSLNKLFSSDHTQVIRRSKLFLLMVLSGFLGFIFIGTYFFDRYFLTVLPFVLLFILPTYWIPTKKTTLIAFVVLLPFLYFSTAATKDYLSWNKARWIGLNELSEDGIAPSKIDGGFEYNAWYGTGELLIAQPGLKSWWFVGQDDYAVAFDKLCGYQIFKSYSFFSYLTFKNDSIVILKKSEVIDSIYVHCGAEYVNNSGDSLLSADSTILFSHTESRTGKFSRSGKYSVQLNNLNPEGFGTMFKDVSHCEEWTVSVWAKNPQPKTRLVVICPENESFYWVSKFNGVEKDGWLLAKINFIIPDNFPSESLKIYIWSPDKTSTYFDDLEITRYFR